MDKIEKSKIGRKSRASGMRFELKVRVDLEKDGWIVDKWTNNVDLTEMKIVKAKRKFNPFIKILSIGTGFPDFIAIKKDGEKYDVMGIEVKSKGSLDKEEKDKCKFILDNKIFSKILIAKRGEERGKIIYEDFIEKYGTKYNNL